MLSRWIRSAVAVLLLTVCCLPGAAPVFGGSRLAAWIRWSMITSGVLSLAGLAGVALGNMQVRNIGILGYVGGFLLVCVLLAILFRRSVADA